MRIAGFESTAFRTFRRAAMECSTSAIVPSRESLADSKHDAAGACRRSIAGTRPATKFVLFRSGIRSADDSVAATARFCRPRSQIPRASRAGVGRNHVTFRQLAGAVGWAQSAARHCRERETLINWEMRVSMSGEIGRHRTPRALKSSEPFDYSLRATAKVALRQAGEMQVHASERTVSFNGSMSRQKLTLCYPRDSGRQFRRCDASHPPS